MNSSQSALVALKSGVTADYGWTYYLRDPFAQRSTLHPARVVMHIGGPIRTDALVTLARGNRRLVMDAIGLAISELVPAPYRGVYADPNQFAEASDMLQASRASPSTI